MTPGEATDSHRSLIEARGEPIELKRGGVTYPVVKAVTKFAKPMQLSGNVQQLGRWLIVMHEDVVAAGFPLPFQSKIDRVVWDGKTLAIISVDGATRRIQGVQIAYELELAGA